MKPEDRISKWMAITVTPICLLLLTRGIREFGVPPLNSVAMALSAILGNAVAIAVVTASHKVSKNTKNPRRIPG